MRSKSLNYFKFSFFARRRKRQSHQGQNLPDGCLLREFPDAGNHQEIARVFPLLVEALLSQNLVWGSWIWGSGLEGYPLIPSLVFYLMSWRSSVGVRRLENLWSSAFEKTFFREFPDASNHQRIARVFPLLVEALLSQNLVWRLGLKV